MTSAVSRRYGGPDDVRDLVAAVDGRPAGTAAELDDATLLARLVTASGQVDAALAGAGRALPGDPDPLADPPGLVVLPAGLGIVRDVALAVAAYLADLTYRETRGHADNDPVLARYRWAQDMLKAWQAGKALPAGLAFDDDPDTGGPAFETPINPAVPILFGPDMLGEQRPVYGGYDPDWWRA